MLANKEACFTAEKNCQIMNEVSQKCAECL